MKVNEYPEGVFWYIVAKTSIFILSGNVGEIFKSMDDKEIIEGVDLVGGTYSLIPFANQRISDLCERFPELAKAYKKSRRKRVGTIDMLRKKCLVDWGMK